MHAYISCDSFQEATESVECTNGKMHVYVKQYGLGSSCINLDVLLLSEQKWTIISLLSRLQKHDKTNLKPLW